MSRRAIRGVWLVPVLTLSGVHAAAPPAPTPEELQERERIRPSVEAALADLRLPAHPEEPLVEQHQRLVRLLVDQGPAVVPFLAAELDLPDRFTFAPSAWALGLVGTPAATQAIAKALDIADREGGGFGTYRKGWCVYGLALAGDKNAVPAAAGGTTPVDWVEFMDGMRLADIAAVLTAPGSRKVLTAQIETLLKPPADPAEEDDRSERLVHAVRALGWVGDDESVAILVPLLRHPGPHLGTEAAVALSRIGGHAAVDGLMTALRSDSSDIRAEAARALHFLRPADRAKDLASLLESEEDSTVRSWLYRDVAVLLAPEAAVEVLRNHRNRPDPLDRIGLARALGETGARSALNLLRVLLRDPATDVALTATGAIHDIGGGGAIDTLLALIEDPRPAVAQTVIETLAADGEQRAAPRIAESVLRMSSRSLPDPSLRSQVQIRVEALVRLAYTAPAEDLRSNAARQADPADREILESGARRLERIAALGANVSAWSEQATSSLPWERALAYQRLGDIGGPAAVAALLKALDPARGAEEAVVLSTLALLDAPAAAEAFSKRLLDPEWDAPSRRDARAAAAWGARRLATPGLLDALEASALRRDGRDFATVVYLAVTAPKRAVPLIRKVLPLRLQYYDWPVGEEENDLLEILRTLEAGAPVEAWDSDPGAFHRH